MVLPVSRFAVIFCTLVTVMYFGALFVVFWPFPEGRRYVLSIGISSFVLFAVMSAALETVDRALPNSAAGSALLIAAAVGLALVGAILTLFLRGYGVKLMTPYSIDPAVATATGLRFLGLSQSYEPSSILVALLMVGAVATKCFSNRKRLLLSCLFAGLTLLLFALIILLLVGEAQRS